MVIFRVLERKLSCVLFCFYCAIRHGNRQEYNRTVTQYAPLFFYVMFFLSFRAMKLFRQTWWRNIHRAGISTDIQKARKDR